MHESLPDLIIHHKDCFDGVCAAWVVRRYVRMHNPQANLDIIPATYGDAPPPHRDRHVVIVDFSYPRKVLEEMLTQAKSLLVLDHHKTAEADLEGFPHAVFDMKRSGAGLAWDWFFSPRPRPWLVNCVEDRDLWKFKLPHTKDQMGWIATVPFTMRDYDMLNDLEGEDVALRGHSILKYISNYGHKAIQHHRIMNIGGFDMPVINVSYQNCSDHLDQMMSELGFDKAAYFFLRDDGQWQFGLRSRGEFDVSVVAKMYGGGGHKNAAGFVIPFDGLNVIFRTPTLSTVKF